MTNNTIYGLCNQLRKQAVESNLNPIRFNLSRKLMIRAVAEYWNVSDLNPHDAFDKVSVALREQHFKDESEKIMSEKEVRVFGIPVIFDDTLENTIRLVLSNDENLEIEAARNE